MSKCFNNSHIYISSDWIEDTTKNDSSEEYILARWHSKKSMDSRHILVSNNIKNNCNNDIGLFVDYGCGGGALIKQLSNHWPLSVKIGIDVVSDQLEIAKNKKIKNSYFYKHYIDETLPIEVENKVQSSLVNDSRSIATLVGVLQNCMMHPEDILKNILLHYRYDYIVITTKVILNYKKQLETLNYSVFSISDLLDLFFSLDLNVIHLSPLYSEYLAKPNEKDPFNAIFILETNK
jgi:SAM-dependent methyltransferase